MTRKKISETIIVKGTVKPIITCPRCGNKCTVIKHAYCSRCGNVFPVPVGKEKK